MRPPIYLTALLTAGALLAPAAPAVAQTAQQLNQANQALQICASPAGAVIPECAQLRGLAGSAPVPGVGYGPVQGAAATAAAGANYQACVARVGATNTAGVQQCIAQFAAGGGAYAAPYAAPATNPAYQNCVNQQATNPMAASNCAYLLQTPQQAPAPSPAQPFDPLSGLLGR